MAKSTYGLHPRERLDYAVLHVWKKVQFPAFGFSPEWPEEQHLNLYSPIVCLMSNMMTPSPQILPNSSSNWKVLKLPML